MQLRFKLPPRGALKSNSAVDPFPYYYAPLIGRAYAARLDAGLVLLDRRFERLLEVGYGSGLLMPTLAAATSELYGADLETEPVGLRAALAELGVRPVELVQADLRALPFEAGFFDGVVAFSILEHLRPEELDAAAREVARVLSPGGQFLIGCPAVHRTMNLCFAALGFAGIENHHFSGIAEVVAAHAPYFRVKKQRTLPRLFAQAPLGWAPYTAVLLERR